MGWFAKKEKGGSGSGDKYAAPDDSNLRRFSPSSDVEGVNASASDDMGIDADRRFTLASASGSSNQLWAPSGSARVFGDLRQDGFAAAAPPPTTTSSGGSGGSGKLTASRLSAFMKGSESRRASLSLHGRLANSGLLKKTTRRDVSASSKSIGALSSVTTSSLRSEATTTAGRGRWGAAGRGTCRRGVHHSSYVISPFVLFFPALFQKCTRPTEESILRARMKSRSE